MSTDTPEPTSPQPAIKNISLSLSEESDLWVARDEDSGVTSQGKTRVDALENLDEAVAGVHGAGTEPTDEVFRALGIDPANNESGSLNDSEIFE